MSSRNGDGPQRPSGPAQEQQQSITARFADPQGKFFFVNPERTMAELVTSMASEEIVAHLIPETGGGEGETRARELAGSLGAEEPIPLLGAIYGEPRHEFLLGALAQWMDAIPEEHLPDCTILIDDETGGLELLFLLPDEPAQHQVEALLSFLEQGFELEGVRYGWVVVEPLKAPTSRARMATLVQQYVLRQPGLFAETGLD